MLKNSIIPILFIIPFGYLSSFSQNGIKTATGRGNLKNSDTIAIAKYTVVNGDTIAQISLSQINVITPRTFTNHREQKAYDELLILVKSVYGYSKKAGEKLKYNEFLMKDMSKSERKDWLKKLEKDLDYEFGGNIKSLSKRQGKILLKLIDRETGNTSYELLTDLRGSFRAFFYNGMGSLFGYNLKEKYDPINNKNDQYIEEAVLLIENGGI